jgi:hypothetical protein
LAQARAVERLVISATTFQKLALQMQISEMKEGSAPKFLAGIGV